MGEKKKNIYITTPAGIAKYPWLQKADTRFNAKGTYKVDLIVPKSACEELCKQLDVMAAEAFEEAKADPKKVAAAKAKRKVIELNAPYLPELDEAGNETGNIVFKFKTNATAEISGELKEFKPAIFDAKGKPVTTNIFIYGGSKLRVNFSPIKYYTASTFGAGVSCRLNAVQVITLVSGGRNAGSFGFGAEDEGFEFADGNAAGPEGEAAAGEGGTPKGASEF